MVASARIEGGRSFGLSRGARKRHDGNCGPNTLHSNEIDTTMFCQTGMGDNDVWTQRARIEFSTCIVVCTIHPEALFLQQMPQHIWNCRVAFDDEHAMYRVSRRDSESSSGLQMSRRIMSR